MWGEIQLVRQELITEYDVPAEYDDSAESENTDDDDDDVFVQTENSDSISEGNVPFNEERGTKIEIS